MSPQEFMHRHDSEWRALEKSLQAKRDRKNPDSANEALLLPARYRQTCQHLALARERHYPPALVERLNRLVVQAHHQLYLSRQPMASSISHFLLREFPCLVRQHAAAFWLSALFFYGPFITIAVLIWFKPALIYSVMDAEQVHQFEQMYDPAKRVIGFERDDASDFFMFGYYIQHNIGIGFKTFAGGIFAGVGSLVTLLFNGVSIGAVAGHLTRVGYSETFWPFVCGHGAFELTAIVLCGMAGLMLGHALIAPGQLRRSEALRIKARIAVKIIYGATLFLIIAAMLEAFWSSSSVIPAAVKYAVATLFWGGVALYLLRAGKERPHAAV